MVKPSHKIPTYYHSHWDDREDSFSWQELSLLALILMIIWSVYWLIIHWVDHFLGDWLAWYVELISPMVALPVMWVFNSYGRNPLHWWPMVWGHRVLLDPHNADLVLMDADAVTQFMGGRSRVWCDTRNVNQVYLKFRRKRDAVWFGLFPHFIKNKSKRKKIK
jgi:hypothetical protein